MPTAVETFEHIIQHQSAGELVPFLLTLDKQQLMSLRQPTERFQKELLAARLVIDASRDSQVGRHLIADKQAMVALTGLAAYTKSEVLAGGFDLPWAVYGYGLSTKHPHYQLYWQVLRHFRPKWLGDLFFREASASLWRAPDYLELRQMEREGLIAYHPPLFALLLGHHLARYNRNVQRRIQIPLSELEEIILADLLVDPELLGRDIWLLFEHETTVNRDFAHIGQYIGGPETTWLVLLPRLVAAGHLDRLRVLTNCLLALRRSFSRQLLVWFKDLYHALNASQAERLALRNELLELLPHSELQVARFALAQLTEILPEPTFSAALLLPYADNFLTRPDLKTGLRTLLAGLLKLLNQDAAHAPTVARLLAPALPHPDSAVQERAAKGLAGILAAPQPLLSREEMAAVLAAITSHAELLGAPARTALAAWLAPVSPASTRVATAAYAPATQFVPELSAATAIVPVADWHELLFLTGQVLRHHDPAATERWLDGLLRLNGQWPAGFAGQLRPYLAQLFPAMKKASEAEVGAILREPVAMYGHEGLVQAMLVSWATDFAVARVEAADMKRPHVIPNPLLTIEKQRYLLAEALLRARQALPLLSTPTHQPHWLAPTALVARLLAYQAAGVVPDSADLAVALARTAHAHPAETAAARRQLPALADAGLRELLQWFLGPADQPLPPLPPAPAQRLPAGQQAPLAEALPELWAVAARTKRPAGSFPTLPAALGYDYAGVAQPLRSAFEVVQRENQYPDPEQPGQTKSYRFVELAWDSGAVAAAPSPLLLYAPPVGKSESGSWEENLVMAKDLVFLLALVPNHAAPLYDQVLRRAAWADNLESSERDLVALALRALLLPGPAFETAETALLASGLVHHTPLCRSLAQEVLVRAVAQSRLVPGPLGQILARQLAIGYAPVPRLVTNLEPLLGIDGPTDDALRQVFDRLLPELPSEAPRNTRKLLEAYADLLARTRQPAPAMVQVRLREWQTSAALKKAVAALLA